MFRRYLCAVVGTGEKRRERGRHNLSGGSETVTIGGGRPRVFEGFPFFPPLFTWRGGCCLICKELFVLSGLGWQGLMDSLQVHVKLI